MRLHQDRERNKVRALWSLLGRRENSLKDLHKVIKMQETQEGKASQEQGGGVQDFKRRTAGILKGKMIVSEDEASKSWLRKSLNFVTVSQETY